MLRRTIFLLSGNTSKVRNDTLQTLNTPSSHGRSDGYGEALLHVNSLVYLILTLLRMDRGSDFPSKQSKEVFRSYATGLESIRASSSLVCKYLAVCVKPHGNHLFLLFPRIFAESLF